MTILYQSNVILTVSFLKHQACLRIEIWLLMSISNLNSQKMSSSHSVHKQLG